MEKHQEVWVEALWVDQHKGSEGPQFIANQITALALKNDQAGINRWKKIAAAYDQLQAGPKQ